MAILFPKISVITPSYNQGEFIEQTILSVIGQQYPNLEYIIIDGGSSDNTLDIIQKYDSFIKFWVSEADKGQSQAINKGLKKSTGDILCWLNSDDYYLPGTLIDVGKRISVDRVELLFGNAIHLNEITNKTHGSFFNPFKNWDILQGSYLVQPSSFWTKKTFDLVGPLREDLHFGFDWEWYARAQSKQVTFIPSEKYYSVYRMHENQKSNNGDLSRFIELIKIDRELNPEKFIWIDKYLEKHIKSLRFIYRLTEKRLARRFEFRLLKAAHPKLLSLIDCKTLKKYISFCFENGKLE